MEKYTMLELLGEGSYGKVMKCRHNETGIMVAIKKFIETEDDTAARKVALREIRMLKKLHHPNLICLLEVFRRKKRFHLVFEYMNCNLLDELEAHGPLPEDQVRKYTYQVLRGIDYCHSHNIIHRDIKPENILISDLGIVKLCDFGFARFATISNEPYTDYVATRWYRPPELLVGDINYGRAVDIWAIGCILIEMLTGEPIFPGDSDIDQLHLITKLLGSLTEGQKSLISKNTSCHYDPEGGGDDFITQIRSRLALDPLVSLKDRYPSIDKRTLEFAAACLRIDPKERLESDELLVHQYFTWDKFLLWYLPELQKKIQLETSRKVSVTDIPCPPLENGFLDQKRITRNQAVGWSLNLINDLAVKESPLFKELLEARRHNEKCLELEMSSITGSESFQRGHDQLRSSRSRPDDGISWKDYERLSKEMPKVNIEYRRNMIPNTSTVRPVKGRLQYDPNLTLPCNNEVMEKPPSEGIYLPLIRKAPDKKTSSDRKQAGLLKRKKSSPKETANPKSQREEETNQSPGEKSESKNVKQNCYFPDV